MIVVDVGGNRVLVDVIKLIDAIMAVVASEQQQRPILIVLKSETLMEAARAEVSQRHPDESNNPIVCPGGWWEAMRHRCHTRGPTLVCDKEAGVDTKLHKPQWYPQRSAAPGLPPCCRFHNYDPKHGCKRHRQALQTAESEDEESRPSGCPLDHEHCHFCLQRGHAAHECAAFRATLAPPSASPPPSPPPSPPASEAGDNEDTTAYLALLASADDATKALRDKHLLSYLTAYEDYTTCHVELEAILKGAISISRARRDLSKNGANALGPTLYPREIAPILTVRDDDEEEEDVEEDAPRTLKVDLLSGDAAAAQADEKQTGGKAGAAEEEEKSVLAELAKWGVGFDLQREIAKAVTDNGDDVGMMCGDAMAIEHRGGAAAGVGSSHNVRSSMGFASSGIDELKHAQFRAALSNVDDKKEEGVKPQVRAEQQP